MIKGSARDVQNQSGIKSPNRERSHIRGRSQRLTCSVLIKAILNDKWLVFSSPSGGVFYQNRMSKFCTWNKPVE